MLTKDELSLYNKYKEEIENFIKIKEMSDEVLFQSTQMNTQYICGLAENIKYHAQTGNIPAIMDEFPALAKAIDILKTSLRDITERANKYESQG